MERQGINTGRSGVCQRNLFQLFNESAGVIGDGCRCELKDGNSISIVARASGIEPSWLAEMAKNDLFSRITITGGNEPVSE